MKIKILLISISLIFTLSSCKDEWKPGMPMAKDDIRIGILHISDPINEASGYAYAHHTGIMEMQREIGLNDDQILYRAHVDYTDQLMVENTMRELIARGVNIIIATSWGYMAACAKLSEEHPNVIFAHASGYERNETNFVNYFGRVYQARYLSGIIAGMKTESNRIGYVAAWGTSNSEVTGGINAFAMGVERVNPDARVYVKVTHSWFDPMGETNAARELIALGCDVIAQHVDTANPQIEAERAGIWGIGYNTDMRTEAPNAVITSVLWQWGAYYSYLVQSVINGTFTTEPWYGTLADGIIGLSPLNSNVYLEPEIIAFLESERRQIESGAIGVFEGIMETNSGRRVGRENERLSDSETQFGIDWYYRTVIELN